MERRRSPGLILTSIGVVLVLLGILAPDLPYAPSNLFLPFMLIFFGRAMSRQARKIEKRGGSSASRQDPLAPRPLQTKPRDDRARPAQSQPLGALEEKLREALMLPPVTAPPARKPAPARTQPAPEPVADLDPPAERVVPEPIEAVPTEPKRSGPRRTPPHETPVPAPTHQTPVYPDTGRVARMPTVFPAPHAGRKTKTSREMVAEAKKRLNKPQD